MNCAPFAGTERHREFFDHNKPPNKPRQTKCTLLLDSRDRDQSFDAVRGQTAPFNFVSRFDTIYNVVAAEVKIFVCPKPSGEAYAVLDIPQFNAALNSTDMSSHQKFAAVFFEPSPDEKPVKPDLITNPGVTFEPPINLNRLDVSIRTWGGAVMTNPSLPNPNVSLVLALTCNEASSLYGI